MESLAGSLRPCLEVDTSIDLKLNESKVAKSIFFITCFFLLTNTVCVRGEGVCTNNARYLYLIVIHICIYSDLSIKSSQYVTFFVDSITKQLYNHIVKHIVEIENTTCVYKGRVRLFQFSKIHLCLRDL